MPTNTAAKDTMMEMMMVMMMMIIHTKQVIQEQIMDIIVMKVCIDRMYNHLLL